LITLPQNNKGLFSYCKVGTIPEGCLAKSTLAGDSSVVVVGLGALGLAGTLDFGRSDCTEGVAVVLLILMFYNNIPNFVNK
jgi:hypothetical protein